ncbi:AAA family ATPase [Silanimonas sp.]|uniref:AAA family ATPase n=1 Tax=Silanimonas sp. TaxID=1929290 RepID=UPI0022C3E5A9|nr:AAA family ATPase [Silanimonas sp.]MCZ8063981.1 AAA family ATPase [Silanimonas sp.]
MSSGHFYLGYYLGKAFVYLVLFVGALFYLSVFLYFLLFTLPITVGFLVWAKARHGEEFQVWKWLWLKLRDWKLHLLLIAMGLPIGFVVEEVAGGHFLGAAIWLAVSLAVLFLPYHIIKTTPMHDYLKLISGNGIAGVRDLYNSTPAPQRVLIPADLAELIKKEVVGQEEAIDYMAETILSRVEMRSHAKAGVISKPIFVGLLVGATGAGKTETAKALAKAINVELLRFDMNQYSDPNAVSALIGPPPGYIGSDKGGKLTQGIKNQGAGVILFDEIEKAHPDFMAVLMTLMDEGRITDNSFGEAVDATQFIILATSNAEFEKVIEVTKSVADPVAREARLKDVLARVWKKEQVARFDAILAYKPLSFEAQCALSIRFIATYAEKVGLRLVGIDEPAVVTTLHISAQTSNFGARELTRQLESMLLSQLLQLSRNGVKDITVSAENGRLIARDAASATNAIGGGRV